MKILVTAGSTQVPIDQVRVISNIFKGRTGQAIACELALSKGNQLVTLITSNPSLSDHLYRTVKFLKEFNGVRRCEEYDAVVRIREYKTYNELRDLMVEEIINGDYDLIIHSAAVSDYSVSQVMVMEEEHLVPIDNSQKISSKHDKMYLELVPTEKLIDKIRCDWNYKGKLVKFKLQVGISDEELIQIATKSMHDSDCDLIVANCLEWSREYAYVIGKDGKVVKVARDKIAEEIERRLS